MMYDAELSSALSVCLCVPACQNFNTSLIKILHIIGVLFSVLCGVSGLQLHQENADSGRYAEFTHLTAVCVVSSSAWTRM